MGHPSPKKGCFKTEQSCKHQVCFQVGLARCVEKLCRDDWNTTHRVALHARLDKLHNTQQLMAMDIRTGKNKFLKLIHSTIDIRTG